MKIILSIILLTSIISIPFVEISISLYLLLITLGLFLIYSFFYSKKIFHNNNKMMIFFWFILLFSLVICICREYIDYKEDKYFLTFFYPPILDSNENQKEREDITPDGATRLFVYHDTRKTPPRTLEKAIFWNQACLFLKHTYCIHLSHYWALDEKDYRHRENYFKNIVDTTPANSYYEQVLRGEENYIKDDHRTEEENCLIIYYLAQNNLQKNKKLFHDNFNQCKIYYHKYNPYISHYEGQFIKLFQ